MVDELFSNEASDEFLLFGVESVGLFELRRDSALSESVEQFFRFECVTSTLALRKVKIRSGGLGVDHS